MCTITQKYNTCVCHSSTNILLTLGARNGEKKFFKAFGMHSASDFMLLITVFLVKETLYQKQEQQTHIVYLFHLCQKGRMTTLGLRVCGTNIHRSCNYAQQYNMHISFEWIVHFQWYCIKFSKILKSLFTCVPQLICLYAACCTLSSNSIDITHTVLPRSTCFWIRLSNVYSCLTCVCDAQTL